MAPHGAQRPHKLEWKAPFFGSFPNLVVSNLVVCSFYAEALLRRPFALFWQIAPFCALLCSCVYTLSALICALLRAFACFCVRPRLKRPRLGTAGFLFSKTPFICSQPECTKLSQPQSLANSDFSIATRYRKEVLWGPTKISTGVESHRSIGFALKPQ